MNQIIAEPISDNADFIQCTARQASFSDDEVQVSREQQNICGYESYSLGLKGYDNQVIDCPYCRGYLTVCLHSILFLLLAQYSSFQTLIYLIPILGVFYCRQRSGPGLIIGHWLNQSVWKKDF